MLLLKLVVEQVLLELWAGRERERARARERGRDGRKGREVWNGRAHFD